MNAVLPLKKSAPPEASEAPSRPIRSVYYSDHRARHVVKTSRGKYARTAVPRAVDRMQVNDYSAVLCEVYDDSNGVLHAVIKRSIDRGEIHILFQREVSTEGTLK